MSQRRTQPCLESAVLKVLRNHGTQTLSSLTTALREVYGIDVDRIKVRDVAWSLIHQDRADFTLRRGLELFHVPEKEQR